MSRAAIALLGLLLALLGAALGYWRGQSVGQAQAQAQHNAQALGQLMAELDAHAQLVAQSNEASQQLRRAASLRAQLDDNTTKELKHALAQTADVRTQCVLAADILRQLDAARERAAQAAASGLAGAVPATAAQVGP